MSSSFFDIHQDINPSRASTPVSDDDAGWDDWEEETSVPTRTVINPTLIRPSVQEALKHDIETHGFCLQSLFKRLKLDTLARIKLINWIRAGPTNGRQKDELERLSTAEEWLNDEDSNEWLIPRIPEDGMLQYDFDDETPTEDIILSSTSKSHHNSVGCTGQEDLGRQLAAAQLELKSLKGLLNRTLLLNTDSENCLEPSHLSSTSGVPGTPANPTDRLHSAIRDDDSHYFASYAHDIIHSSMIRDHVRTQSYMKYITSNPTIFKNKRVIDIGCGTGILSFFAAQAGAKQVYAIDASEIAINAAIHMKKNGLTDVVKVIQKKVEHLDLERDLDGERVDVIISEWMGYACLYEVFLPSVLIARDQFLKTATEGGIMAPSQCSILMAGWSDESWWNDHIEWWDNNTYGFKMGSTMTKRMFKEGMVENVAAKTVLTPSVILRDVHTSTMPSHVSECIDFTQEFALHCTDPTSDSQKFHGFLVWFDTFFTTDGRLIKSLALDHGLDWKIDEGEVGFSTSPKTTDTHWHQTILVIKEPFCVQKGTVISGTFSCSVNPDNGRELVISIVWKVKLDKQHHDGIQGAQVWNI